MAFAKYNYGPTSGVPLYFDDFITQTNWVVANKLQQLRVMPSPATNVVETQDALLIELIAPGLGHEDLQVQVAEKGIEISYEQPDPSFEPLGERQAWRQEFGPASFRRQFDLNDQALDLEAIAVRSENGIISFEIPKREEYRGRLMPVHPFSTN